MDRLELGVIVAVIVVVLYWVVVLPARERKKRERERARLSKTHPGASQPWDPNVDRGRRNR
jgi:type II secretory pathway component PulM